MPHPNPLASVTSRLAIALAALAGTPAALAADLVVTAYGGSWEKAYRECFVEPFERQTGKTVDVILGNPLQWINQIAANPASPPIDVMVSLADTAYIARERGLVEPISAKEIPNLAQLHPHMLAHGAGYGFPIAFGNMGLMYSKSRVADPPRSWQAFVDGVVAGKWQVAVPGINYVSTIQSFIGLFAVVWGGSLENVQPGLDQIKRLQDSGNAAFYSEPNMPVAALKSGEIDIAMYFDGRAWLEHDSNNPDIGFLYPAPGAVATPTSVQKVKNGSPLGFAFMNVVASAEGQSCFADIMQYSASNRHVTYSARVQPRVPTDADSIWLPFAEVARNTPRWVELWNQQIGR